LPARRTSIAAANVSWPLTEGWDDGKLEAALFPTTEPAAPAQKAPPDFGAIGEKLRRHGHATLRLLREEYREGANWVFWKG
jgi:hypothetical protein